MADKRNKISYIKERYYPLIIAGIVAATFGVKFYNVRILDDVNSILSAVLSYTAIIIGFLGVLISILFSTLKNGITEYVMTEKWYKKLLKKYFSSAFVSGFLLILFTIIIFFRKTIFSICFNLSGIISVGLKIGWIFLIVFFSLASYRIISVIIKIAFRDNPEIKTDEEKMDEEKYEELKKEKSRIKE